MNRIYPALIAALALGFVASEVMAQGRSAGNGRSQATARVPSGGPATVGPPAGPSGPSASSALNSGTSNGLNAGVGTDGKLQGGLSQPLGPGTSVYVHGVYDLNQGVTNTQDRNMRGSVGLQFKF